ARKECATCHARMDPLGFALERFDATGSLRERDGDAAIDDTGALPNGDRVDGLDGLRKLLRARSRAVARAFARKLLVFGLGRGPIAADDAALEPALDALGPEWRVQDLIVAITKLDAFQKRRAEAGKS